MTAKFLQLVYSSMRVPGLTDAEFIDTVALPSVRRNRIAGITGCLWLSRSVLVGALEGEPARVEPLYATIAADPRHTAPDLLFRAALPVRQFHRYAIRWIPSDRLVGFERLVAAVRESAATLASHAARETTSAAELLRPLLEWSGPAADTPHDLAD